MEEFIEKLISRLEELYARNDKTKKTAYEERDWEKFDLFTHRCEGIYSAIEIVKQEAEQYNNGWIPCSSGVLPKHSNSYCVTKMCENEGSPIYETCHEIFWTNDNKWDCERDEDCKWRVIAWKEKDKSYQSKGE